MSTIPQFLALLDGHGSPVVYHRESGGNPCPCRTVAGNRSPKWHAANPGAPVCNEDGFLAAEVTELSFKGMMQPIQSTRATRLTTEFPIELFGEIQQDDHLGIFPVFVGEDKLSFYDWPDDGTAFLVYNTRRFNVVNANMIPDPADGNPEHHWEVGCRLLAGDRP